MKNTFSIAEQIQVDKDYFDLSFQEISHLRGLPIEIVKMYYNKQNKKNEIIIISPDKKKYNNCDEMLKDMSINQLVTIYRAARKGQSDWTINKNGTDMMKDYIQFHRAFCERPRPQSPYPLPAPTPACPPRCPPAPP